MLTIWTYDWVPNDPRGYVRDFRLRWACEEAGLPYQVRSTPFRDRGAEHFARQPFGQVPFLEDGDLTLFESGACVLHIAGKNDVLMPIDPAGRAKVLEWSIAALNSIEIVSVSWAFLGGANAADNPLTGWVTARLRQADTVLQDREWLVDDRITAADIIFADVMRQTFRKGGSEAYPAIHAYIERVRSRPAFQKAYTDQIAHFAAGD